MNMLRAVALTAVVGSAFLYACSSDDSGTTPPAGGTGGTAGTAGAAGAAGSTAGAAGSTAGAAGSTAGAAGEAGAAGAAGAAGGDSGAECAAGAECMTCCATKHPAGAAEIMGFAGACECTPDAGGTCGTACQSSLCDPDAGMPSAECQTCLFTDATCLGDIAGKCTSEACGEALACVQLCMP
jgi:hypothetical protein